MGKEPMGASGDMQSFVRATSPFLRELGGQQGLRVTC